MRGCGRGALVDAYAILGPPLPGTDAALALGMMALLTLTLIRGDLLRSWQATLKPDTPNRFVISIQPEQVKPLAAFFADHELGAPAIYPMVRGRLIAINGRGVSSNDYPEERAKRLIARNNRIDF